jgi:hypothetical protein
VVPLRGRLGSPYPSAKQNKRFLLLFLEKEDLPQRNIDQLLGASPQTPVVPLRGRVGQPISFCEAEQTLFKKLLFLEKEDLPQRNIDQLLGASPQTPVVPLRGRVGQPVSFCEAELRFLLLSGKRRTPDNRARSFRYN